MSTSRRSSTARRSARLSSARISSALERSSWLERPPIWRSISFTIRWVDSRWRSRLLQLVVDVVDLALQPLLLLLEPVALPADLLEPLAAALQVLGVLGVERRREESDERDEHCIPSAARDLAAARRRAAGQDPSLRSG